MRKGYEQAGQHTLAAAVFGMNYNPDTNVYRPRPGSIDEQQRLDERLNHLKGKSVFNFLKNVDEQTKCRIYALFLGEEDSNFIDKVTRLLHNSNNEIEFNAWKAKVFKSPSEDFLVFLSTNQQNILCRYWNEGKFKEIVKYCKDEKIFDKEEFDPYKKSFKYISSMEKDREDKKGKNIFLQMEGRRMILKEIASLPKETYSSSNKTRTQYDNHSLPGYVPIHHPPTVNRGDSPTNSQSRQIEVLQRKASKSFSGGTTTNDTNSVRGPLASNINTNARIGDSTNPKFDQNQSYLASNVDTGVPEKNEKAKKEITILLLGETGAGKTTFINGLVNYLLHQNFDSAYHSGPRILTETVFTITDDKHNLVEVREHGEDKNPSQEILRPGQSVTQNPMIRVIPWKRNGETIRVNIIDTPGMNDTRGFEQDKKNFDKIFALLKNFPTLHSICFVMKPNESKLRPSFTYCLNSFLSYFHRNAVNNIIFCFTNTRSLLYRPGDTLASLNEYLKKLWDTKGIMIKPTKENTFCFDNDSFRYLLALRQNKLQKNVMDHKLFTEGWTHNVDESQKFLEKVMSLPVHKAEDSVQIKEMAALVSNLSGNLGEMALTMLENMKIVDENKAMLKNMEKEGNFLASKLISYRYVVIYEQYFNCYNCHNKYKNKVCSIRKEQYGRYYCATCNCSRRDHYIDLKSRRIQEPVKDEMVMGNLEQLDSHANKAEMKLKELERENEELDKEYAAMNDFCAEAAVFVKEYSIKTPVDNFKKALALLIEEETYKSKAQDQYSFTEMFYQVSALLQEYESKVKEIEQSVQNGDRQVLTNAELQNRLDHLKTLSSFGELTGLVEHHRKSIERESASSSSQVSNNIWNSQNLQNRDTHRSKVYKKGGTYSSAATNSGYGSWH